MSDEAFFYKATCLLCSSLLPESAVQTLFSFLTQHIALKRMSLSYLDFIAQEGVIVATVTEEEVVCPFQRQPLSPYWWKVHNSFKLSDPFSLPEYLGRSTDEPFAQYLKSMESSVQVPFFFLRLVRDGVVIGSAVFEAESDFSDHDLHLLRGLDAPLCMALNNILQHRQLAEINQKITLDNQRLRNARTGVNNVEMIGTSRGLASVMEIVRLAAPVDAPLLITGETGTGKEVVARATHSLSGRSKGPFVALNCGALPATLLESELFGYARGAFTGAVEDRKGFFERAEGGTLFLDELGELPLSAQSRLLRVLETGMVDKVGGQAPVKVNMRLLAATNRHLEDMVREGTFRADLYYRLKVLHVHIPPLRERKEDIPNLASYFLKMCAERLGVLAPPVAEGEAQRLLDYAWPGNVRELRNVLEAALVCANGKPLVFRLGALERDQPQNFITTPEHGETSSPFQGEHGKPCDYDSAQRRYFQYLIRHTRGRIGGPFGAAALARLNVSTFRSKCRKHGIALGREAWQPE